jgi:hypothetical protein
VREEHESRRVLHGWQPTPQGSKRAEGGGCWLNQADQDKRDEVGREAEGGRVREKVGGRLDFVNGSQRHR